MTGNFTYVVIASGRPEVRHDLLTAVARMHDIVVVGEVDCGQALLDKAKELSPHVVLMDVALPGDDCISTIRRLKEAHQGVKVLMAASAELSNLVVAALLAGASGYSNLSTPPEVLETAIRSISYGAVWLDGKIMPSIMSRLAGSAPVVRGKSP